MIWIVIYNHKHGTDVWPVSKPMTDAEIIADLRAEGDWGDDEDGSHLAYVECRGPYEVPVVAEG